MHIIEVFCSVFNSRSLCMTFFYIKKKHSKAKMETMKKSSKRNPA